MNWQRIFTGVIVCFLFYIFIFLGKEFYTFFVTLVAVLALWEFYKIVIDDFYKNVNLGLSIISLIWSILLNISVHVSGLENIPFVLFFYFITIAFYTVLFFDIHSRIIFVAVKQIFGFIYISIFFSFLIKIRSSDFGIFNSLMTFFVVASGDVGAYYIGALLGRHKLCLKISPKKTIEGAIGGLFSSIVMVFIVRFCFSFDILFLKSCIFGFCLGILGQLGDLFISEFKRMAKVKDSGKLLPGHGGILDRIDGLLFAIPAGYFFLVSCYYFN